MYDSDVIDFISTQLRISCNWDGAFSVLCSNYHIIHVPLLPSIGSAFRCADSLSEVGLRRVFQTNWWKTIQCSATRDDKSS